jgi:hypothetical protein
VWDILPLILVVAAWLRTSASRRRTAAYFRHTGPQWRSCYSRRRFLRLGGAAVVAGVLAHSGIDEAIDREYAREIRSPLSDTIAGVFKIAGERAFFAVWALLAALDVTLRGHPLTRWGRRNFEAMLVGLPLLWSTQRVLGAGRPLSPPHRARWRPFASDHAASGHTFMAAIPCLTLAGTVRRRGVRWLARLTSTLTGWSRLNDRMHYLSQIILGYSIAWTATAAVLDNETLPDSATEPTRIAPPTPDPER